MPLRHAVVWTSVGIAAALAGCTSAPVLPAPAPPPASPATERPAAPAEDAGAVPGARGSVVGRNERLLVYLAQAGDSAAGIARRFLGSAELGWQVTEANSDAPPATGSTWAPVPGQPLVVPLLPRNPLGVGADGVAQTVIVLCYHRIGTGAAKMIVSPAQFEEQLEWLARHHYTVVRLADLAEFMAGRRALPQRSVVITLDDGYESVHRHAWPALARRGWPATLFVYTDFIGTRDGLSWAQLQEMAASGTIDIQAHSKTHRNLAQRGAGETDAAYRLSLDTELRLPRALLERRVPGARVRHFAYPYGDASDAVVAATQRHQYELGLTVNAGGNAFYAAPLLLRRTMIFGDHDIDAFASRLQPRPAPRVRTP